MKIFGSTRIYGVKLVDVKNGTDYSISATVRDLYDTLSEEGDNVSVYLMSPGGFTKSDSLVKVKSINKLDKYSESIYRLNGILGGINESITGNDSSIYCSGDTRIKANGIVSSVELMKISPNYEILELDLDSPDMYSITLDSFSDGGNIIRTSIDINGVEVMIN